MKKTFSIFACAAAILCSCTKEADCLPCQEEKTASLEVSLAFEESPSTRAVTPYTTSQTYEKQVNKVQVFIFDESGRLNVYRNAGTSQSGIKISTTAGKKTVWAVVNGPDLSSVSSLAELEDSAVDLSANSTSAATGFVMAGSAGCTVGTTSATATVNVSRLVSRVALQKVTNSLPEGYGALTIDNVTLTNVAGNQNIAGDAAITTWYNKMGRKDGATAATQIIDGAANKASCEALTFRSVQAQVANAAEHKPSTPYLFYTFPNGTAADATGWADPFTPRKARMVVAATIGGTRYYYPVTISNPERNKAYTVELTITGLGSGDPDTPIEKGALEASIAVQEWEAGATYEEVL